MSVDLSLGCIDCSEVLINVGRRWSLNRQPDDLDRLESFLNKHADHKLIYDADDSYPRILHAKLISVNEEEEEKDLLKHLSVESRMQKEIRDK